MPFASHSHTCTCGCVILGETTGDEGRSSGRVSVLLLGYGGASLESLSAVRELYATRWPSWQVVTTVRPGIDFPPEPAEEGAGLSEVGGRRGARPCASPSPSDMAWGLAVCVAQSQKEAERVLSAQHDAILAALAGCEKLIVHLMSNNGVFLWRSLLSTRRPSIAPRLAAIVYDCAPATMAHMTPSACELAVVRTVLAATLTLRVPLQYRGGGSDKADKPRDVLSKVLATAAAAVNVAPSDAESPEEPSVATLFLTSADDNVIPEAGVRAYADAMRTSAPHRSVSVQALRGAHCMLAIEDRAAYAACLEELAAEAGFA